MRPAVVKTRENIRHNGTIKNAAQQSVGDRVNPNSGPPGSSSGTPLVGFSDSKLISTADDTMTPGTGAEMITSGHGTMDTSSDRDRNVSDVGAEVGADVAVEVGAEVGAMGEDHDGPRSRRCLCVGRHSGCSML